MQAWPYFWWAQALLILGSSEETAFKNWAFNRNTASAAKICARAFEQGQILWALQKLGEIICYPLYWS